MVLTYKLIEAGKSLNGGWSRAQVEALGVKWPLVTGWKKALEGKEVTDAAYKAFLRLSGRHTKKRRKINGVPHPANAQMLVHPDFAQSPKPKKQAYVVYAGRTLGIFETWAECWESVDGYPEPIFKGYWTYEEAVQKWEAFEAYNDEQLARRRWDDHG